MSYTVEFDKKQIYALEEMLMNSIKEYTDELSKNNGDIEKVIDGTKTLGELHGICHQIAWSIFEGETEPEDSKAKEKTPRKEYAVFFDDTPSKPCWCLCETEAGGKGNMYRYYVNKWDGKMWRGKNNKPFTISKVIRWQPLEDIVEEGAEA